MQKTYEKINSTCCELFSLNNSYNSVVSTNIKLPEENI
jgi:hypothetical protein